MEVEPKKSHAFKIDPIKFFYNPLQDDYHDLQDNYNDLQDNYNDLQPITMPITISLNELCNHLQFTMTFMTIYNSHDNQIQLLLQSFTIGSTTNYNSIVIKYSVLCTMACRQRPRDC